MADEYVQVHPTMLSHRKVRRLARELDITLVAVRGHLTTLWMNCLTHAQDGNLEDLDNEDIAHYAEWDDSADVFVNALIRHGWLDVSLDSFDRQKLELHDWDDYTGRFRLAERRRYERERKALQRSNKRNEKKSHAVPGTVPELTGTPAKCLALTEQNRTEHVVVDACVGDISSASDLEALITRKLGCPALPPKWIPLANVLAPLTHQEVEAACRIARRQTPESRSVNAGLVMRVLERQRQEPRESGPVKVRDEVATSPLQGLPLLKAKARWQTVFDAQDVAWSVHDDQARWLEKLGVSEEEALQTARETIADVGDSWEDFYWRIEATRD